MKRVEEHGCWVSILSVRTNHRTGRVRLMIRDNDEKAFLASSGFFYGPNSHNILLIFVLVIGHDCTSNFP